MFTSWLILPEQNDRHFVDDICKRICLNENDRIWIKISPKYFHMGPIGTKSAMLTQFTYVYLRHYGYAVMQQPPGISQDGFQQI